MGSLTTQGMSRLTAAGSLSRVDEAVRALADLKAVHLLDYPGDEEGFDLGSPTDESEEIGRDLNRYRSASSQLDLIDPKTLLESEPIRGHLDGELPSRVEMMLGHLERLDVIDSELSSMAEEGDALELLLPLDLDLDLLSGYGSLTAFVGTVKDASRAESCAPDGLVIIERVKPSVVAVFCKNDSSSAVQSELAEAGFAAIPIPDEKGPVGARQEVLAARRGELLEERSTLQGELDVWAEANGATLLGGIELLERDMALALGPIRVAVSGHAFVIDGWVETSRSEEVSAVLSETCRVVDIEPFKVVPGGGGHGHHGPELKLPPIKFADRHKSKPMELLTDLMGRPRYGKVDPTLFMFFTYPLFFGLILGDILYGAATMLFGYFLYTRIGHTETGLLASKFIVYIGFAAVIFGYIYGEFAGFEILPHMQDGGWVDSHAPAWASWLTALYPNGGMIHWDWSGPFGVVLAYPFHRVVPTSAGGNLEDLILLTIYMGVVHVLFGLLIGFRDIWLHGDSHGNTGPIIAIFDRGSWITILFGGFLFCYGFLGLQNTPGDELLLTMMRNYGAILAAAGILMLIYASYRYHGMPLLIAVLMGPIEGVGMMPTVISYVRLFAVGAAGVKIAETGNDMLYGHLDGDHGVGMLGAISDLGHHHVEGAMLMLVLSPVLAAIAIKLFSNRLPSEASQFGLLHGMTASGILGMVLAGVETQTMGMVLSPLLVVPVLLQGLGSLGMLNTTLYGQVRLAELAVWFTGLALVGGVYMVVTLAFAWLGVQIFAWVLGLFSPNIHTARLHLVEWMKQFYEAVGDEFKPFGFTARVVEVE